MTCAICGESMYLYTYGRYHNQDINTTVPIYYCNECNSFIKKIDSELITTYFKKSVYTNLINEQESYDHRIDFFNYIYTLTKRHNKHITSWLDYGSSYGHFVEFLNSKEIESCGIEISDEVRYHAIQRGLEIYIRLEDLPQKKMFGVISFIDSLYYSATPKVLLEKVYNLLYDNGLLVLRVVNRNWLTKFDKQFRKKKECTALIDHTIGYSHKSITYLLNNNGFKIIMTTYIERGKYRSQRDKFLCTMATFCYFLSFGLINIMPGIIIIAKKNLNFSKS